MLDLKKEYLTETQEEFQTDEELIINKIKDLITSRQLESGDRLPSERKLSEKFNVSRSQVRSAIQKLEFYGLLKTLPKSGTVVSNLGVTALNGMMRDILKLQRPDFKSLVETRIMLEKNAVWLAAQRRSEEDLQHIEEALKAFESKLLTGESAVEEDMMFHLKLVEAGNNSVMHSLVLIIVPEIITYFMSNKICSHVEAKKLIKEHEDIFNAIKEKDPEKAEEAIDTHFTDLKNYCYS
ncbi:FadR family transcriptional regulator [Sinomicrobium pectinilyticum]|uniref:FadR family transcriptional regulator n=1 Tax=Sinomicrobium pectinilyticum TaxID=1084421 RepID=A0A3N0EH54_SINP1|nr:FadR/GntR family transcriptional regulator [Sinomicrobium pectinilyticum]RNL87114.1 FadR family transcriptional regulator [Sinomicrobium pectinilyticum]